VQNGVAKEKTMVAIENEVARIRTKITDLTVQSLRNQDEEINNDERIMEAQEFLEYFTAVND